jgi:hypothetical protein
MLRYSSQVSWLLIVAFGLSLLYEFYRSTAKNGISKYDSMRSFLTQGLPFYAIAFALAVLVLTAWAWVAWTALARWSRIDHRLDFLLQPDCVAATKAWPDRLARGQALHGSAVRRGRPCRLRPTREDAGPVAVAGGRFEAGVLPGQPLVGASTAALPPGLGVSHRDTDIAALWPCKWHKSETDRGRADNRQPAWAQRFT